MGFYLIMKALGEVTLLLSLFCFTVAADVVVVIIIVVILKSELLAAMQSFFSMRRLHSGLFI